MSESAAPTPIPDRPVDRQLTAYGAFTYLYMNSPTHRRVSVDVMRAQLRPAVEKNFYRIVNDQHGVPRAGLTWAFLSDDAEARLRAGHMLAPEEWASGRNVWLMEFLAPFGQGSGMSVLRWLRDTAPDDMDRLRYTRFKPQNDRARVVEIHRRAQGRFGAKLLETYQLSGE
jgi:hemolysin-activating ACP:hemolysin acyltransferase